MNERIRELLKQSTNPPWDGEQGPMNEFNLEKFAELIVRKCASIADIEKSNLIGCGYITKTKGMLIKEHFGVEE